MKKWMIVAIIVIYTFLIGLIIYYNIENNNRKKVLTDKVSSLKLLLDDYYKNKYDNDNIGKIFTFPGETNVTFDDTGIMGGEAFIYSTGTVEIALYDGKYCAYQLGTSLKVTKTSIDNCVVNRSE